MKLPDDMLPEERDPQYEELITLLQQANLNPMLVDPTERAQVLSRARARLFQTDPEVSKPEDMPVSEMRGLGSHPSEPKARAGKHHRGGRLFHLLNGLAAVLVVTVLLGSASLIFGFWSPLQRDRHHIVPFSGGQPKLTILTTQASIGQTPELSLAGFTPNTSVRLTHDGGQLVQTTTGASVVTVGQDGTTLVEIFVDRSFLVGLHVIEAQDTTNHVTVRATLRVVGANPARSPQLALGVTSLDMGAGRQGTKSVRSFLLENVGGGSIAWSVGYAGPGTRSASSLPSWLIVSPPSGMFSQSETITITVDRGTLSPDFYLTDALVFLPQGETPMNAQENLSVRMTMIVLSQPAPIMVVSPLNLTFNAMQGQSSPPAQVVSITNTGEGKLNWNMGVEMDGQNVSWLRTTPTQGVVSPGQTEQVTIRMNTKGLTPGTHQGSIDFWEVDSHGNGVGGNYQIELGLIVITQAGAGGLNSFAFGQCTYWANFRYHQLTGYWVDWLGNAYQWKAGAEAAGWIVSSKPNLKGPSIIVLQPEVQGAGYYGQVAIVEKVNSNGSVYTSNFNWYANGGWDTLSYWTFTPGPGVSFVWHP